METIRICANGQVPSGKNQVGLCFKGGKVRRYPNKRFSTWRESFALQARTQTQARGVCYPMRAVIVYRQGDLIRRDVPGQLDALWHGLVYAGILDDDYWIREVICAETLDRKNPGVIIELTATEGIR